MHAWLIEFRPRRVHMTSHPVAQSFQGHTFTFHPWGRSLQESLAFDWDSLDRMLPSLHGTIAFHRFGPVMLLRVDAGYRIAGDTPGRLLKESVGRKSGLLSLRYLCQALHSIITSVPNPSGDRTAIHDSR